MDNIQEKLDDINEKLDAILVHTESAKKYSMLGYWVASLCMSLYLFKS